MAVGGSGSGWAEDNSCSVNATATASAAARARSESVETEADPVEFDALTSAGADSAPSLSAVSIVNNVIINQSKRIAPKTSPMPSAVIWRESIRSLMIYTGIFPCLRGGAGAYLSRSADSDAMIFGRDSRGSMMSST